VSERVSPNRNVTLYFPKQTNTFASSQEIITFWKSEHDGAKFLLCYRRPFLTFTCNIARNTSYSKGHGLKVMYRKAIFYRWTIIYDRLASFCTWSYMTSRPYFADEQSYDRLASLCRWSHMTSLVSWNKTSCMPLHAPFFLITSMNSTHIWCFYGINVWKDKWNCFVQEFSFCVICRSSRRSKDIAVPLYDHLKWCTEISLLDASWLVRSCSARSRLP
jgi:hypothetical protein